MASINWDDIAAGGLGAVDELLLGAPEWLLKNLGNRQAVEDYIKAHEKAYRAGETVGTVGGALIPVGAIAKGAKTALGLGKAAKTALAGGELARLAEKVGTVARPLIGTARAAEAAAPAAKSAISEIARLAGKGAKWGGAEAAARGLFDEESAGQIAQDIGTGTLFGGLGGAAGGLLSKGAKYLGKSTERLAGESAEKGMQSFLGRTDLKLKDMASYLRDIAGTGAKGFGKEAKADEALEKMYEIGKKYKLQRPGMDKAVFDANRKAWKDFDAAFEAVNPGARGSDIIAKAIDKAELEDIAKMPGGEVAIASLEKILKDTSETQGLFQIRDYLSDVMENARNATDAAAGRAQMRLASSLRRKVDEMVMNAAENANLPYDFKTVKSEYLPLRAFAESAARATVAPSRANTGSATMEKLMAQGLIGNVLGASAGGTLGALSGSPDEDMLTKMGRTVAGGLMGFAGKRAGEGLVNLARSASVPLAKKLAASGEDIAKVAEKISPEVGAVIGGREAGNIANMAAQSAEPTNEAEEEAATAGAEAGQAEGTPQYTGLIMAKLSEYAAANGVEPGSQDFKDFVQTVASATISPEGQPFDPRKMAKLLYPDPEQRAKYLKALDVSQRLSSSLAPAIKSKGGVFGIGEDVEERINREAALDKLGALVGEVAKAQGTEKAARKQLQAILGSRATQSDKKRLIMAMLESYGVDFDTLAQAGLANV